MYKALQPRDMIIDGCLMILGCTCQHLTFRKGRVGWCSWSLSLPWWSGAVCWAGAAAWTRVSWRAQYCHRGCLLGCPEQQRQCLRAVLTASLLPCPETAPLLSTGLIPSLPVCEFCLTHLWCLTTTTCVLCWLLSWTSHRSWTSWAVDSA